jgi:hypothetical protein
VEYSSYPKANPLHNMRKCGRLRLLSSNARFLETYREKPSKRFHSSLRILPCVIPRCEAVKLFIFLSTFLHYRIPPVVQPFLIKHARAIILGRLLEINSTESVSSFFLHLGFRIYVNLFPRQSRIIQLVNEY